MEKMTLKIIIEPTYAPCGQCEKHCIFSERGDCEKINEYNDKIIRKAYDYDEAIERMAKAFCETGSPNTWDLVNEGYKIFYLAVAEAALNALLGGGK